MENNYLNLFLVMLGGGLFNLFFIPKLIKLAHLKDIVDLPGVRKVHRNPVAIMGGVGIMLSVMAVLLCFGLYRYISVVGIFGVSFFMGCLGLYDDITDVRAIKKFILELTVGFCLYHMGFGLNDLHGIFGITEMPILLDLPLSIFAFAGICNAINLIDGVDGLLTGLCGFYATFFALLFLFNGMESYSLLSAAVAGALIPAFLFNVFGTKNKLFMGDCGALFLGVLFYCLIAKGNQTIHPIHFLNLNPVSLWISLLSVPVMDTLRVMSTRILRGRSPFSPDKTHLHHFLLRFNLSHKRVTASILLINLWIVITGFALALHLQGGWQLLSVTLNAMFWVYLVPLLYYLCVDRYDVRFINRLIAFYRRRRIVKLSKQHNFIERLIK